MSDCQERAEQDHGLRMAWWWLSTQVGAGQPVRDIRPKTAAEFVKLVRAAYGEEDEAAEEKT